MQMLGFQSTGRTPLPEFPLPSRDNLGDGAEVVTTEMCCLNCWKPRKIRGCAKCWTWSD